MVKKFTGDFETRSAVNLKTAGAYKYSRDPSTQPTCFAFKIHGEAKVYFLPFKTINTHWKDLPESFKTLWQRLVDEGYLFSAHNAFFETCIYKNILVARYGWPDIDFKFFRCTAAKAAACALPRNLAGAGEAMKLQVQKDRRGHLAMLATCKPTRQWNEWNKLDKIKNAWTARQREKAIRMGWPKAPPMFLEDLPCETIKEILSNCGPGQKYDSFLNSKNADLIKQAQIWETLYTYCKIDVRSEEELDNSLPDLNDEEQEIWFLNQRLNWRGLRVDIPTVQKIADIMEADSKKKLQELDALTMGLVTKPGARQSILEFLALDGIELPDIRAKTVQDALNSDLLTEDCRRLLEIRKALSKTSTRKYQGFLARASEDHRVRDILLYHGASTGRDTGTGIQPHNFPRGIIPVTKERPYAAVENIIECNPELLRLLYGDNLSMLFSSVLRNMLIPSPGKKLYVADFSKVEVAVLWWLADNKPGLKILNSGKDPYIYQAAMNTGKSYEAIEEAVKAEEAWALDARQLGKAQILGGGFGMGATKFQSTAWDMYRLKLTIEMSKEAVMNYRNGNPAVPQMWKNVERAAIEAIENKIVVKINKCKFFVKNNFLWIELPSGRRLAYREPRITWRETDFGSQKTIEFWAVNSKTKKWAQERTWGGTLTENIVQAVARDLMMPAMLRLENAGFNALLMVHDEGICEGSPKFGELERFTKIMTARPKWADEYLPIDAKGWEGPRYRK